MSLEKYENFYCPYCGQENSLSVDISGGSHQEFVVDCEICCAPITIHVTIRGEEVIAVNVRAENE